MHTYIHKYIHIHTYVNIHIHTNIHTCYLRQNTLPQLSQNTSTIPTFPHSGTEHMVTDSVPDLGVASEPV